MPQPSSHYSLATLDPRVKILLTTGYGILAWHLSPVALGIAGGGLGVVCARAGFFSRAHWPTLRYYLLFVLFWAGLKFALDCTPLLTSSHLAGSLLRDAAMQAGLLAGRLCFLIALGLLLAFTTSTRQLGLALAWFLRPVLGKHAWQPALSLALMIHFLPLVQNTIAQVRAAMLLRAPKRSRWERFLLVPQAVLRILAQKVWTQTVAVAARRLDRAEAWSPNFPPQPMTWGGGILCAACGGGLLLL